MKKVLIVDDSETIRMEVSRALRGAGFAVIEASDGVEGLERVSEHKDLSMVILDVNMPRMNGLDMLERMRKTSTVPALILTTEAQQSMIARAKSAGAKGWVVKPVKMDLLVSAVVKLTN
jgi:two-component system, chemotaxis family, chemotaxis protein CheY